MATVVLTNGKFITADEQFSVHEAVAIDGERIATVGPEAAVRAHAGHHHVREQARTYRAEVVFTEYQPRVGRWGRA